MQAFLFVLSVAWSGIVSTQQTDVCSQVSLMNQYCTTQGANETEGELATFKVIEEKMNIKFVEMEARLRSTLGSPPPVNYTLVEETIAMKFRGVEEQVIAKLGSPPEVNYTAIDINIQKRFESLEAIVNGAGDGTSIVDYHRIEASIEARFKQIQAFVEAKFARILNDSEEYQQALEDMKRRVNVSDCRDVKMEDAHICNATGGVFDIYRGIKKYRVFCDVYTDGGGWTVFQRRMHGSENFSRSWDEYVEGFGDVSGEFWLGLQNIHELLQGGTHELRIDIMDTSGRVRFQKYETVFIAGKGANYNLMIQGPTGDLGNYMLSGKPFSTIDRDLSGCIKNGKQQGGWWAYYYECDYSNLNGVYGDNSKMFWATWKNLVKTEMKFRKLMED